jgi:hypothetical protein
MPATKPVSLQELAKYPRMTAWFELGLLAKLLWRVVVSDLFGQYADRRLIVAALDPASDEELVNRAQQFMPGQINEHDCRFTPDADGSVWIDFVADLGDGFDATYAIASLLSQETLTVGGHTTQRGQMLLMGGDEVYPNASTDAYKKKLRDPYDWAFPDPAVGYVKGPPVYAIPGNHDWYDGLVVFLALFSRKEHLHLGGWRSHQRRSYFALQITANWWIWAMDAQLDDDVDQPQKDYFAAVSKRMPENSNIIICGPEPGWLYTEKLGSKSFGIVDYVCWIAARRCKGVKIPIVLSGDTHHYSRYVGDDNVTQFITSGGGGAFLHPTHQLKQSIDVNRPRDGFSWLGGRVKKLSLATDPSIGEGKPVKESLYPPRNKSLSMLKGNAWFAIFNPGFAILLGFFYWLLSFVVIYLPSDFCYLSPLVFFLGFWGYTKHQEGGGVKVAVVSAANAVAHSFSVLWLTSFFQRGNAEYLDLLDWPRSSFLLFGAEMVVAGGIVAGFLFGLYLYVSSRWLNLNHNDAFSSMRLDDYRNFLRIRIKGDEATVYPVGLDTVPKRNEWRVNTKKTGSPSPEYIPASPFAPRLIEGPIIIRS